MNKSPGTPIPTRKGMASYCAKCHSYFVDGDCGCKSKLKLYEVTVHVERPFALASTHKEVLVVLLATDSSEAMAYAEESQGVTEVGDRARSTWTEILGPFKNGYVLAARDKDI